MTCKNAVTSNLLSEAKLPVSGKVVPGPAVSRNPSCPSQRQVTVRLCQAMPCRIEAFDCEAIPKPVDSARSNQGQSGHGLSYRVTICTDGEIGLRTKQRTKLHPRAGAAQQRGNPRYRVRPCSGSRSGSGRGTVSAVDLERVGAVELHLRLVDLAALGIVDRATVPGIRAGRLEAFEQRQTDDRARAQLRIGVVDVRQVALRASAGR